MRKPDPVELFAIFRVWLAAQMQSIAAIKRPDPVEVVLVVAPVLIEAVAVTMAFACAVVWIAIANVPVPA